MSMTTEPATAEAFRLDNKRALGTGGASGIGEATCRELARAGAHIFVADINLERAKLLAAEYADTRAIALDVTSQDSIHAAGTQIGQLDILVNNAGIGHVGNVMNTEPAEFNRLIEVNVKSVYLVTRAPSCRSCSQPAAAS
jgi:2-keto-3-deoxy-L-fuconate dehydrogenase